MISRIPASVALTCSIAAASCVAPRVTVTGGGDNSSAALDVIKRTGADFSRRYMRGDAQGMAEIYTEDGVILPPGRPMIKGRTAIGEYWKLAPGVTVTEHRTVPDSIVIRDDIAYDYGTYYARTARDGLPGNPVHGKYVIVWRRVPDGRWLMHLDIWNGSPAPAP